MCFVKEYLVCNYDKNMKRDDVMLNKKGFTIIEVIVSFSLISLLLASLISATMFYRDKVKDEEVNSQLWDFKNTITKLVYDDIIAKGITRAESCIGAGDGSGAGAGTCINLIDKNDVSHVLKIVEYETDGVNKKGVYLSYDDVKYRLPDSDLGSGNERICDFVGGFTVETYDNKIYKVKISFRHKDLNKHYDLLFVIN